MTKVEEFPVSSLLSVSGIGPRFSLLHFRGGQLGVPPGNTVTVQHSTTQ